MLTIRFSRIGKKRKPFYRVIISEKSKDTKGNYLELLGHYNPHTKEATLKVDRIKHWLENGATASSSVFNLLVNQKIIDSEKKRKSVFISKKRLAKKEGDKDEKKGEEKSAVPDDKQAEEKPEKKEEAKDEPAKKKEDKPAEEVAKAKPPVDKAS